MITTIEQLEERIAFINEQTKKIADENPGLDQSHWSIKNLPYEVFEEYRQKLIAKGEERQLMHDSSTLWFFAQYAYGSGANIVLWTVSMKFKVHQKVDFVEIIKEENVS